MDEWKLAMALLLTLSALRTSSSYRYASDDLRIDCGSSLDQTKPQPETYLNLPLFTQYYKFLFRAGFLYDNYDGLSKPPSFRLEINGHFWANVMTSLSEEPVFHEFLYIIQEKQATVCLVRTNDDEVPFISSLEATAQLSESYKFVDNKTALYLHSRINYGREKECRVSNSVEQTIGSLDECCNRIWKSKTMPNYLNIHSETVPDGYLFYENTPPWPVMAYAIQAHNVTESIYLTVDLSPKTAVKAYLVLYFMDPIRRFPPNQTSSVEIYVDSVKLAVKDVPTFGSYEDMYHVATLFPVWVGGSVANVTISPAEGSTIGPILNAMEVFSAVDVSEGGRFSDFSALLIVFLHLLFLCLNCCQ
ncbi:hypothetical protein Acr_00g0013240 [Actinidia rufa]|uniref:Malectin-like domain-containing protein n=1 Tax=Actinidia rufa TaxID=165716 RepID=A0A7J0D9Y6_9ERIC|nr:hypothetical protein Acr_00g0013240 [Actinidia rufa]